MDVCEQRRHRVVALVGNPAGEHLVEDAAERVDVGAGVRAAPGDLFRRHVVDRADHRSLDRQSRNGVELLGQSEVGQVGVLLAVLDRDQDVRGLDVAVHEAAAVGGVQRGRELLEQLDRSRRLDRPLLDQDLAEVGAGDVVHDEEQHPLMLARVMDPDDVRVMQRGGDARLALEPLAELLVLGERGRQHLERVDPVQRDVRDAVDEAHAAAADQLVNAVAPDHGAALQLVASYCHRLILSGPPPTHCEKCCAGRVPQRAFPELIGAGCVVKNAARVVSATAPRRARARPELP